jgi:hypothetical protein
MSETMEQQRLSSVTLFAVSCAVLMLEVALTRLFSLSRGIT